MPKDNVHQGTVYNGKNSGGNFNVYQQEFNKVVLWQHKDIP